MTDRISRKRNAKPKIGEVIEVNTPSGLAYAQYTHYTEKYGTLLRRLPGLYSRRPASIEELAQAKETYFFFYPLVPALKQGLVHSICKEPIPEWAMPFPLMRMEGNVDRSGRVLDWWLWNGDREWPVGKLTPELAALSIVGIWTHPYLVEMILRDWTPAYDRANSDLVISQEMTSTDTCVAGTVQHYVYFPSHEAAADACKRFQAEGYLLEMRPSMEQWLVLVHQDAAAEEAFSAFRDSLERLAELLGGEYDGWEVAVGPDESLPRD